MVKCLKTYNIVKIDIDTSNSIVDFIDRMIIKMELEKSTETFDFDEIEKQLNERKPFKSLIESIDDVNSLLCQLNKYKDINFNDKDINVKWKHFMEYNWEIFVDTTNILQKINKEKRFKKYVQHE